jgi:hypothetical protein
VEPVPNSCDFALLYSCDQQVCRKHAEQSCFGLKANRRRSTEYQTPHQHERPQQHDNDNALSSNRRI